MRRALLSVFDKRGLDELARGLADLGVELLASGGTADWLEELGLAARRVDELTEWPELLGGRVKTLHPRVHAGILARRDDAGDLAALERYGIPPIDLVCVNLYPFEAAAARREPTEAEAIELIDVGGVALLRAAAKNFRHVAALCSPAQYERVLAELRVTGGLSAQTRRSLAAEAFALTASYDAAIARWFAGPEEFPDRLVVPLVKELELAYGENPHQRAAYYREAGARRHLLSRAAKLGGRDLSYNNLNDLWGARALLAELEEPACVIVKHANPCGAAVGATIGEAYARALACDPVSAYGGVVALNRPVDAELAAALSEQFIEVLAAPGFSAQALAVLRRKEALRILETQERRRRDGAAALDYRRVLGGMLVQEPDMALEPPSAMDVVTRRAPDEREWGDLLLAWRTVKHVTSNAIVLARGGATVGIGAGQMSRVDAVRIAIEKAREQGHDLRGAVLASDAFFPFPDGPRLALEAGVTAIVQPGGSRRDAEVAAAVEEAGAAMVFTHRRHFRH